MNKHAANELLYQIDLRDISIEHSHIWYVYMTPESTHSAAEILLPLCQYRNIALTTDDVINKLFKIINSASEELFFAHIQHLNTLEIPNQQKRPLALFGEEANPAQLKKIPVSLLNIKDGDSEELLQLNGKELTFITKEEIPVSETGLIAKLESCSLYRDKKWISPTIEIAYHSANTQDPGGSLTRSNAEKYVEGFNIDVSPRIKEIGGHVFIDDNEESIVIKFLLPFMLDGVYTNPREFSVFLMELLSNSIGVIAQISPQRLARAYSELYPDEAAPLSEPILNTFNHWLISIQTSPEHAFSSSEWRRKVTPALFHCLRTKQPKTIRAMADVIKAF